MFYLARFCRVCVRSGGPLIDIESEDADTVKLADKLRSICAKMVISQEDHCRLMCYECVQKLRISYFFQTQCTKADAILEQYLEEITSACPGRKFVNSELKVTLIPVQQLETKQQLSGVPSPVKCDYEQNEQTIKLTSSSTSLKPIRIRRNLKQEASFRISETYKERIRRLRRVCPRITKQQRCMLLKSLLTKNDHTSNSSIAICKGRKYVLYHAKQKNQALKLTQARRKKLKVQVKGGLRDLLGFIQCYDFGFKIKESEIREQCERSVIDRLESFSRTFFYHDFRAYRETILSLANESESSDEGEMFGAFDEAEDRRLWPECNRHLAATPTVIKEEAVDDGAACETVTIKEEEIDADLLPSALVQACYDDHEHETTSPDRLRQKINQGFKHFMRKMRTVTAAAAAAATAASESTELSDPATIVNHINRISVLPKRTTTAATTDVEVEAASLSSLDLLTRLTNSTRLARTGGEATHKPPAPPPTRCHLKCRTRGNPFISPHLMQQFQARSFRCDTCQRCFKSPGYLHSHCTKMGH